jgi:hypothetical protein
MKSVIFSYNFASETQHDLYRPQTDKDISRFMKRLKNDRTESPASDIKAFRVYENGNMETLE